MWRPSPVVYFSLGKTAKGVNEFYMFNSLEPYMIKVITALVVQTELSRFIQPEGRVSSLLIYARRTYEEVLWISKIDYKVTEKANRVYSISLVF